MRDRRFSYSQHFQARGGNLQSRLSTEEVTSSQADVLRGAFGHFKQPSVELSQQAGTSERAARNHLSGANCMNLTDFFNACRAIPELAAWGRKMMGLEGDLDPRFQEDLARFVRAAQQTLSQRGGA